MRSPSRSRLYPRKDSKYWWAEFIDVDGIPRRRSTHCRDHARAKEWLALREGERIRAEAGIPLARSVPLIQALAQYIAIREKTWSTGWRRTVWTFVKNEVLPYFGEATPVREITRSRVEEFHAAQIGRPSRRSKKNPRPVAPATVNRLMAALDAFGRWAADEGRRYTLANPFTRKPLAEGSEPPPVVSPAEVDAFLAHITDPRVRGLATVAIDTGLRKSELARLAWSDVDLEARLVIVVSSHRRGMNKGRKTRPQVLTRRAADALAGLPGRREGLVFGRIGDHRRALATAAKKAGLGHVWFHALRHFGASLFSAKGASRHELQLWGGWTSTRMSDRYSHADMRQIRTLIESHEDRTAVKRDRDDADKT